MNALINEQNNVVEQHHKHQGTL